MRRAAVTVLAAVAAAGTTAAGLSAYADGPPPAHTGGFGEPTCRECHFDGPEEPDGVRLEVGGLPSRYRPGERYTLTVVLEAPELRRGGFELSARFLAGDREGAQAGSLEAGSGRVEVVAAPPPGGGSPGPIAYARQTSNGSLAGSGADGGVGVAAATGAGSLTWRLTWTAPDHRGASGCPTVALDVAANASNDDASEFGDRIVSRRLVVPGPRGRTTEGNRWGPPHVSTREAVASSPPP